MEAELKKKLDPKHVKTRKKGNTDLSYIEAWHVIDEANNIFGFDGWKRETVYNREVCRYDYEVGKGQYASMGHKVGYEAKVLVTVDGVTREGTGHGSGIAKDLFDAIEGAAKEAESDAMKRAFMTFGYRFGLALYDKEQKNVGVDKSESAQKWANDFMNKINDCKDERDVINLEADNAKMLKGLEKYEAIYKAVAQCIADKKASFVQSPTEAMQ